jgi:hypothetical protein
VSDDDPRWRSPEARHGFEPVSRMGPPPRSFAADAHDCIMVRSLRTYRIQGCGAMIAPDGKLPSDHRPDHNQRGRRARACQGAAGKRRSVRPRAERRPTLTGPVRVAPQHVWVGAKKRDSESNKETGMKEVESGLKSMLDFKSPIQGVLRLHSHYGPLDCSAAQGDLCHEASVRPIARPTRSSATRSIDNSLDGFFLHW